MGFIDHRLGAVPNATTDGTASTARRSATAESRLSARVFAGVVQCSDGAWLAMAAIGVLLATMGAQGTAEGVPTLAMAVAVGIAGWTLRWLRTYDIPRLLAMRTQAWPIAIAMAAGGAWLTACLLFHDPQSVGSALAWVLVGGGLLAASRVVLCPYLARASAAGRLSRHVAVIGVGPFSDVFMPRLQAEPQAWNIVGLYDDRLSRVPPVYAGTPVLGTVEDLVRRTRTEKIDVIVIALPLSAVDRIATILEQVGSVVADICLTTGLAGLRYSGREFSEVGANAVLAIKQDPVKDWQAVKKTVFDRSIATLALLLASPVLAFIALAVRIDSPGPILFRQPRLGFDNKMFCCLKFRTMRQDTTDLLADRQTIRADPRLTRLGPFLRRFSLDELPQLLNVLQGTMSLVGPRPHAPNTKAADRLFADVVARYAVRHRVKPGMTGWAQVNGWRGETLTVAQIENRVAHDLHYIDNWSIPLDLKIIAMTVAREVWRGTAF